MTAPDPRLDEIKARLEAATPGPWGAYAGCIRQRRSWRDESKVVVDYDGVRPSIPNALFIANAPADVTYLLAELAARDEALGRVEALAAAWESRGEYDMAYSKTIPDEYIAIEILKSGAQMVDDARLVREAIAAATGGGEK